MMTIVANEVSEVYGVIGYLQLQPQDLLCLFVSSLIHSTFSVFYPLHLYFCKHSMDQPIKKFDIGTSEPTQMGCLPQDQVSEPWPAVFFFFFSKTFLSTSLMPTSPSDICENCQIGSLCLITNKKEKMVFF